jgi:hypothetical protein
VKPSSLVVSHYFVVNAKRWIYSYRRLAATLPWLRGAKSPCLNDVAVCIQDGPPGDLAGHASPAEAPVLLSLHQVPEAGDAA